MSNNTEWETVVRIVYPTRDIDQVWPLYALDWTQPILSDAVLDPRIDMNPANIGGMNQSALQRVIRRGPPGKLHVHEGGRTSLCTFFNAFPAGYWRRWTRVNAVRFEAEVCGTGRLVLYRSNGRGLFTAVGDLSVKSARQWRTVSVEIPWMAASAGSMPRQADMTAI